MKKVSVIIPCYNEQSNIRPLYEALTRLFESHPQYAWEVVMINDGSTDQTLSEIRRLREHDPRICYVDLSRNFGKERAMLAGFDYATGDCAAIIDADLQHPPMVIGQMLELWEQGYQDVYAQRQTRGRESFMRKHLTRLYYRILQRMADTEVLTNVGDFRLLDRRCIDALRQLRETQRYTKGLYCWIGFRKTFVPFTTDDRREGHSSFNTWKLFNLAVEGITSYSTAPLRMATVMGTVISLLAFVYMIVVLMKTIIVGEPVPGYPTLICVILLLGGLQLLSIGIIGEYLSRIFHESKQRPVYIVNELAVNERPESAHL
ncbi:MAG: glycosyltransferase family 2 protein [Prevotella sp.]|nr:glycosyltransferase family 2 protein [Prevotella sp.]MBQ9646544.1 glycosyltransferase family 2 protein [Prevotella sp.]